VDTEEAYQMGMAWFKEHGESNTKPVEPKVVVDE
jgi:hypothetical protein